MKTRTFLGLVLIGLVAAVGCREKAREVVEEQAEVKDKNRDTKDKDKLKKPPKTGSPEKIEVEPSTEPNDGQEEKKEVSTSDKGWGTVKGTITYEKDTKLPDNPPVNVTNDKAFCLMKGPIHRDVWVVDKRSRGVKNVIVWLSNADATRAEDPAWTAPVHPKLKDPAKSLVIDQPTCAFMPRIFALREGTEMVFKNSALVSHNVKIDGGDLGPNINKAIAPGEQHSEKSIKARFIPTEVACTIHPWMKSWLISFTHPYYAVTDDKGHFEIRNAPPGKYRLQIWHEHAGFVQKSSKNRGVVITVTDGKTTTVDQQIKED